MQKSGYIEVELIDGRRVLISSNVERIHNVTEKVKTKLCFSPRFPWVKTRDVRYTQFQYRPDCECYNADNDPKYRVNCRLAQFMKLVGVEIKPFPYEQFQIENDLNS